LASLHIRILIKFRKLKGLDTDVVDMVCTPVLPPALSWFSKQDRRKTADPTQKCIKGFSGFAGIQTQT
jgi:hypothetical protein